MTNNFVSQQTVSLYVYGKLNRNSFVPLVGMAVVSKAREFPHRDVLRTDDEEPSDSNEVELASAAVAP